MTLRPAHSKPPNTLQLRIFPRRSSPLPSIPIRNGNFARRCLMEIIYGVRCCQQESLQYNFAWPGREGERVKPPFTQTPAIGFGEQNPSSSIHPNSRPFASNHFGLERRTFYINHRHYGSSGCPEKDFTWSDEGTRIVDHRPPTDRHPLPFPYHHC